MEKKEQRSSVLRRRPDEQTTDVNIDNLDRHTTQSHQLPDKW